MKVRLDRVGDEPFDWQETLALSGDDLSHPEVLGLSEVVCRGQISLTAAGHLFEAELTYDQTLSCTRCLGEVTLPMVSAVKRLIELRLPEPVPRRRTGDRRTAEEEQELSPEDLGVLVVTKPLLDTRGILLEHMQLSVPMKVLCRDRCAGLCETCGADLNAGPCECRPAPDSRWGALARWQQESGES